MSVDLSAGATIGNPRQATLLADLTIAIGAKRVYPLLFYENNPIET